MSDNRAYNEVTEAENASLIVFVGRIDTPQFQRVSFVVRSTGGLDSSMHLFLTPEECRDLAASLVGGAAALDAARQACTGERYLLNPDYPEEGTDIHHDGPCAVHALAASSLEGRE